MAKLRAKRSATKPIRFNLSAPQAKSVLVTGSFCDWQTNSHHLKKDKLGTWKAKLALPPGTYEYRYLVDGEWCNDPTCQERVGNAFGTENCILDDWREGAEATAPLAGRAVILTRCSRDPAGRVRV